MREAKLYMTDELLALRQKAIFECATARASAIVRMGESEDGLSYVAAGKDVRLYAAYAEHRTAYITAMHRAAWDTYPDAEVFGIDCFGEIRREPVSPYKEYVYAKLYDGGDRQGDILSAPEDISTRALELMGHKQYLTALLEMMTEIAQDDTVSYAAVRRQLAECERDLMRLHLDAIEYIRGQGYVYETVRPRWWGGRIALCKK